MIKNYFKIAIRNLLGNKMLSFINILGLAIGIACCLLIALYVHHEMSYDKFHTKGDRIVRVTMEYAFDGEPSKVAVTGNKVFPAFRRDFPEVENGVRIYNTPAIVKYGDKVFDEKAFVYADSTLFDMFSFRLLKGSTRHVLQQANTVVLTASSAKKYFAGEDPIGKTLRINNQKDFIVTGVAEDCPGNSQIKFDMVASFYSLDEDRYKEESWWDASYYTYLLLKDAEAGKTLEAKIPGYMRTQRKEADVSGNSYITYHLEPLKKVHLYSKLEGGLEPAGDYRYPYIFSIIAVLILGIACANYMNLTIARASKRAKEVGIRKVIGAFRKQLFGQFMGESIITVAIALFISLLMVKLLLPTFNLLSAKQLTFSSIFQPSAMWVLVAILLTIGLAGGSYPALILSAFNPLKVLKGNFKASSSGVWLRKSLIVIQFIISVSLIVCTIIIQSQLSFIQNKKLGYNKEHVVVLPSDKFVREKISTLKSEFRTNPNVLNISTCNQTPAFIPGQYSLMQDDKHMIVTAVRTDKDFIKTLELKLLSGSDFTDAEQLLADSIVKDMPRPIIINESAAKLLGWTAQQAVGKAIKFQGKNSVIKGVVNDFHFSSMHDAIGPFIIFLSGYTSNILVKLSRDQLPQTLEFLKEKWRTLAPHRPFEYEFIDDQFNKLYTAETRTGKIFYVFALLAIGLACLGLFGLAAFTAQQRMKEIGIRKVLGASVVSIVTLLSKDFIKLVLFASIIAFPLSLLAMSKWLEDFVYRVKISWVVFAIAGITALLIALITISFQAIKAAIANPVKNLRTE